MTRVKPDSPIAGVVTVPLLDLKAQFVAIREPILAAIVRVCEGQQFILGPEVEALERDLASLLEVRHAIAVSSGTDALLVAMMALGIGAGDEVITPTFSFFATAGCVARLGARPVLVDIDSETFNIDPEAFARAIGPGTKAVIPVHLFGLSADLAPILDTASRSGIGVIDDAAQAIGSRYRDRAVGSQGTFGCFSFFPTKNLGAFGDGGLVTTNDSDLAHTVRLLRAHGAEPKYFHRLVGGNFRLDAVQAAILRVKAAHLGAWTERRRENAARYVSLFEQYGLATVIRLPSEPPGRFHTYNQFVIRAPRRDALREHLARHGVATEIYYPVPFHLQECFAYLGYPPGAFPHAEAAAREVLALPIYPELPPDHQDYVVRRVAQFYGAHV